jgi:hypothetical protein
MRTERTAATRWTIEIAVVLAMAGGASAAAGCGEIEWTASEACRALAEAECRRVVACFWPEEREARGWPVTGAMCLAERMAACEEVTWAELCGGEDPAEREAVAGCAAAIGGAACEDWASPAFGAEACDTMCRVHGEEAP